MNVARIKIAFAGLAVVITGLWLLSLSEATLTGGFWPLRNALVYLTGFLAIGFMSAAVILAARPIQIEGLLGGLDKFYRLHKWLGIAAAVMGVVHWLLEITPRWMVGQGWLERPQRPARAAEVASGFDPFRDLHEVAAGLGEPGLYLVLILVALALWKGFPYRYFFNTHRLLAAVYLALVFHSVILMGPGYWAAPVGPVMGLLMAAGSAAAVTSLVRRIGKSRRAVGSITSLDHHTDNAVLDVGVQLTTAWPGHHAGQFAFVNFGGGEGAHPFTIASAWRKDGRLMFSIKGLGDYTRSLPEQLFVGQAVTVEGPYGRFDFRGERGRQIWIGGGIGITPFIAGLQALEDQRSNQPVDLIYSTSAPSEAFIANIRRLAERAGVRFLLMVTQKDDRLTLERLEEMVPEWKEADLWFCGPLGFGRALRDAMTARGLPADRFHQELFDMR
ncbi:MULTISPECIES: ferric reductase-like transmembrane domain-containing protein [Microvirga]|uniref:Ferric reductase-like transmembrane domain-containing protein n=1 Tax=Microvirga mediterraneensis TaxID=2754695 RepID=A0A838BVS1_9HYPH|nr:MULTISPECIES: ferric reductase-like transmembrane domain-containing protein [Microvirga]MBA1159159.1 ferric reductase-like transmembrane domain-containing protein [Microvirga mediterraneensis]